MCARTRRRGHKPQWSIYSTRIQYTIRALWKPTAAAAAWIRRCAFLLLYRAHRIPLTEFSIHFYSFFVHFSVDCRPTAAQFCLEKFSFENRGECDVAWILAGTTVYPNRWKSIVLIIIPHEARIETSQLSRSISPISFFSTRKCIHMRLLYRTLTHSIALRILFFSTIGNDECEREICETLKSGACILFNK